MRRIPAALYLVLLGLCTGSASAVAQSRWLPRLQLDNDAYDFWKFPAHRPDEEYSNGVQATLTRGSAPWWGRRFAPRRDGCADAKVSRDGCLATSITLGQDIYTPNLKRAPFTEPDWEQERPYFGWLYLEGAARIAGERLQRSTAVTLGVTGPPSLGHVMQSLFHAITRPYTRKATGWETQIGFEPGAIVSERVDWLALRIGPRQAAFFDLAPSAALSLGNVLTSADAGATARLGRNLSHPWNPRDWSDRRRVEFFVLAAARGDYVAHDMSLDGNSWHPNRSVERTPTVTQYQFGVGLRLRRLSLEYRATTRGREYATGPGHHTWASMTAALEP